jgi:hypothetical protein
MQGRQSLTQAETITPRRGKEPAVSAMPRQPIDRLKPMPVVFRDRGFRFFFYSNEGSPREARHIHVDKGSAEAKFWLFPDVRVPYNHGFEARILRELLDTVTYRRNMIERAWHEFFG